MHNESPRIVRARVDDTLVARIVSRKPLLYVEGASEAEDRPAFVRAASGIARFGDGFAIVQDDASFIALVEADARARALALPKGPSGRRRFEKRLGNKNDKLDLESCVSLGTGRDERFFSFGSGSLPVRERIVVLSAEHDARVIDAAPLHAALRSVSGFAQAVPNIEGVAIVRDRVRIFHRANGEDGGVTASLEMGLDDFLAWIDGRGGVPALSCLTHYDLGAARGVCFSITDVCARDARIFFLACAEDSVDAIEDGEVLGSLVGVIADGEARVATLFDDTGARGAIKAEGLALDSHTSRAFIVLDQDDPDQPSELCEVVLEGPWGL